MPKYFNRGLWAGYDATLPFVAGVQEYADEIFAFLNKCVPHSNWKHMSFMDLFAGSGALVITAKRYGFKRVVANDIMRICHLANNFILQEEKLTNEWLQEFLNRDSVNIGFVEANFDEYFAPGGSQLIDELLGKCCGEKDLYFVLRVAMMLSDNSKYAPQKKHNRRSRHWLRALELVTNVERLYSLTAQHLNAGIFPTAGNHKSYELDYREVLKKEKDIDLVYLAPPYGNVAYQKYYWVYESLVKQSIQQEDDAMTKEDSRKFMHEIFFSLPYQNWLIELTEWVFNDEEFSEILSDYVIVKNKYRIRRGVKADKVLYFCEKK